MNQPSFFKDSRTFIIMWAGKTVSSLGSGMTSFALLLWVYQVKGTATSVTLMALFAYLPSIAVDFLAGAAVEPLDKKKVMLASILASSLGTVALLALHDTGALTVGWLYAVSAFLSLTSAFQSPAVNVAVTILVRPEHYPRASGLQSMSDAIQTMAAPVLATLLFTTGGLSSVLTIDLVSFGCCFLLILSFVQIPAQPAQPTSPSLLRSALDGLVWLREHTALFKLIEFMAFVNLLAYLTGFGLQEAMILARTGNNQAVLSVVVAASGVGTLAGSLGVTIGRRVPKRRVRAALIACAASFAFGDTLLALGRSAAVWILGMLGTYLPLPYLDANLTTVMRTTIPVPMQARVFSARDTLQFCTIPLGLLVGGPLADHVFEPVMRAQGRLGHALSLMVGTGPGAGMAVMFLLTAIIGTVTSLVASRAQAFDVLG